MAVTCPNKSLRAWTDLVDSVGENKSYSLWSAYDGVVPEEYYTKQNKKTPQIKEGVDFVFDQNPELANAVYEALGFEIPTTKLEGRKIVEGSLINFDIIEELASAERSNLPSSILIKKLLSGGYLPKINKTDIVLGGLEYGIWRPNLKKIEAQGGNKSILAKKVGHELLHSVTHNIIYSYQNLKGVVDFNDKYNKDSIKQGYIKPVSLTKSQIEALDNLVRIRNKVVSYIEQNKDKIQKQDRGFGAYDYFIRTNYTESETDLHEFISEVFTNPELISILKEIPTEGKKSNLFKDFVNAIAKILGFSNTSILEDIIAYSEEAFFTQPQITQQQKQQAQQLYSQYLDTIFPDSKVKDIVYHGSHKKFKKFEKGLSKTQYSDLLKGFYFSNQKAVANAYTESKEISIINNLLNIKSAIDGKGDYYEYLKDSEDDLGAKSFKNIMLRTLKFEGFNEKELDVADYDLGSLKNLDKYTQWFGSESLSMSYVTSQYLSKEEEILVLKALLLRDSSIIDNIIEGHSNIDDPTIYPVMLDMKNPDIKVNDKSYPIAISSFDLSINKASDSVLFKNIRETPSYTENSLLRDAPYEDKIENSYVVFEPEQIHILGSKQDIEGFREFINNSGIFYSVKSKKPSDFKTASAFLKNQISFKSKMHGSQFSDAKLKLQEFNTKWRTAHELKRLDNIGETDSFNVELREFWNGVDVFTATPKQISGSTINRGFGYNRRYWQLPAGKSIDDVNEELDSKLKQLLSKYNITVQSIDNFAKERNIDAIGMADILKGIIYVNENESNLLTLPEETAHFIIELMGEAPLKNRLLSLMENNDKYIEILGEKFGSYNDRYKGNKQKLIKEAAGKVLSEALVYKFDEQKSGLSPDEINITQRIWRYIKNLFKSTSKKDINQLIAEAYGRTAEEFLSGTLQLSRENLKVDTKFYQLSDRALNSLRDKLVKSKEAISKRINVYKRKDFKKLAAKEEELLKSLISDIDDQKYLIAALNVAESARKTFKNVGERIAELQKSIANLEFTDDQALLELSRTLRDMKSFTNSYLPMAKEIQIEMSKMSISDPDNEDVKKISDVLSEVIKKAELLDSEYLELGKPIFAKFGMPYVGDGPINFREALDHGGEDITFAQRFLDAAANTGEPMLQIIDVIVKDAKQKARDESYDIMKDIIEARMKLEKAGIKDTKWTYEVKSDGTLSGNNVYEYNYGDWADNKDKEIAATLKRIRISNKGISLPESDHELLEQVFSNDVLLKQYNTLMNNWYRHNSQKHPDADAIIKEKKSTLSEEDYKEWFSENTTENKHTGEIYYIKELSAPSEKYRNKQYSDIMNNPAKKEFYELTMKLKDDLDSKLPQNRRLGRLAPQLRTDFIEKAKGSKTAKEFLRNTQEAIREQFQNVEDESDLGDRLKLTDENNKVVNFLPIYFTGKLKNPKDLSTDFAESLSAFATMSNDYSQMSKIIDMLELGRDIISNRPLLEVDSKGNILKEIINVLGKKIAKNIKKEPGSSNLKARLDDYYLMNIYGKTRIEGKDWNILGYKINSEKALDFLGKYTAINNLALNIYAGIQNPLVGNTAIRIEAIAGQFIDNKALLHADKVYYSRLPKLLANIGSRNPKDWLSLWDEKMEVMQDFSRKSKELNMDRSNLFSKMFNQSVLFFQTQAGEHQMQNRTSLALAYNVKLKDKDGKDITMLDAFDIVGNKFELKKGLKKPDGSSFTEEDVRAFKRRQNSINNSLHGIYNDQDLLAIQQYAALRLALQFRKFMRPGYNRRFRKYYYNYEGQYGVEGYYRTMGRFALILAKDIKRGQFLLAAHWNELTDLEKSNIIRASAEAAYMISVAMLLNFILPMLGSDDEDNWAAQMAAYQATRLNTELRFYIDPRQTLTILKSPAAGIDRLNGILNLLSTAANPWYASEVISKGKWAGYTRLHKASVSTIPLYKTVSDWKTPEDKILFFRLNK